jgi:hypothetical protein
MSLLKYEEVRPWAKGIRNVVSEGTMPPFHAKSPLGTFDNDNRLTPEQIQTMVRWVDAGAPRGNPADAPPPAEFPSGDWSLGEPDIILEFPEYTSKTNNIDEEILLFSDQIFANRTWIQAFEFKTSDYRVVHHAGVFAVDRDFIVPPDLVLDSEDEYIDKFSGPGAAVELLGQEHMFTWLPGQRIQPWAEGAGIVVPKGSRIVIQTHIPPMTEAIPFKATLGIWLVDGVVNVLSSEKAAEMKDLVVPPGEPDYVKRQELQFHAEATVYGYTVHMHLRGESSQIIFHYPDGTSEVAFDLPRFDFDWQRIYWLNEPKVVPAGTRIEFVAEWDNSPGNPLNPDPTAEVIWGGHTSDEMYGGHVFYSIARKKPIRVENGIRVDNRDAD